MKHFTARTFAVWAVVSAALAVAPAPARAQNSDAITITPADFNIAKSDAVERLDDLEGMAAVSVSTADYARAFREFQDDLGKVRPPVAEWSAAERERVEGLKQPTDAAWQALALEEQKTQQRLQERSQEAEAAYERRQQQARENQKLAAEQARTDQQLRLQEAQIRESEARSDYYDDLDDGWGSWYNPWWHTRYPGSPIYNRRNRINDGYIRSDRRPGSGNRVIIHDSNSQPKGPRTPNNYNPGRR